MLFEYYYSKDSGVAPRKTLRGGVKYTHCVCHNASNEARDKEIHQDAVLVAIEDVNTITTKEETR